MLLVLAMLAGALSLTVARAEPAWAYSVQRSPTEIVITSVRLHDETVRTTHIITLRSNGDVTYRVDAHNSGRTRKFVTTDDWVRSPAGSLSLAFGPLCKRIGGDTYDSWAQTSFNSQVAFRWNDIVNDPNLAASFHLNAYRVDACNIVVGG